MTHAGHIALHITSMLVVIIGLTTLNGNINDTHLTTSHSTITKHTQHTLTTNGLLDAVVGFAFPGISAVISQYPRDIFRAITKHTQKGPSPLWKKLPYPFGVLYYGQDS